jgi:hypothetical protein
LAENRTELNSMVEDSPRNACPRDLLARFRRLAMAVGACLAFAVSPEVLADGANPFGIPDFPFPTGLDITKAPLGSWAEYELDVPRVVLRKVRFALIARDSKTSVIEVTKWDPIFKPFGGHSVVRLTTPLDPTSGPIEEVIMQLGDDAPMPMPEDFAPKTTLLTRPKRKQLGGKQKTKVQAGTFLARPYTDATNPKGTLHGMVSDEVPPFGLLSVMFFPEGMEMEEISPGVFSLPDDPRRLKYELVAWGGHAEPAITRPVKPFDPQTFMHQIELIQAAAKQIQASDAARVSGPAKATKAAKSQ